MRLQLTPQVAFKDSFKSLLVNLTRMIAPNESF